MNEEEEKIIELHINQHLTPNQIRKTLNLNMSCFRIQNILKKHNVYTPSQKNFPIDIDSLKKRIDKEQFITYYETHSKQDTEKFFNLSHQEFKLLIKEFNYRKSKDKILEVRKQTCQKLYGVDNCFQNEKIKDKIKQTNIRKYGVKNVLENKDVQNKMRQNIVNTYGSIHDYYSMIRNKSIKTLQDRYGTSSYSNRDKYRNTLIEKYGSLDNAYKDFTQRSHQAILDKYGSWESYLKLSLEKREKTCLEKYGCKTPFQNDKIKEKIKQTCIKKYGVDNPSKSNLIKQKISQINKDNTITTIMKDYNPKYIEMYNDKEKSIEYLSTHPKHSYEELSNIFNCSIGSILNWIWKFNLNQYVKHTKSKYENELLDFIKEIETNNTNIYTNSKSILDNGLELDVYIPSKHLGIEFNGTYWHSICQKDRNYHLNKSKLAQEKGIRLIHIYQFEWEKAEIKEKIKQLLRIALSKAMTKIHARKCEIKEITNKEAKLFNEKNHLQGHRNAQVTYGLFYNNELVQLMSFSKTKYNRNLKNDNEWEIIRGCPGSNNIVVGGVSKLFKHFLKEYNPSKVFSYCDFNKFDGKGYEAIGMKFIGYTGPDMKWVMRDGTVKNRCPNKHKELKENSMFQIFGAGSKKYLWQNNEEVK